LFSFYFILSKGIVYLLLIFTGISNGKSS